MSASEASDQRHRIVTSLCRGVGVLLGGAAGMLAFHTQVAFVLGAAAGALLGGFAIDPLSSYFERKEDERARSAR